MLRDLLVLPTVPGRLVGDLRELKELVGDLLATEEKLTHISESMDGKVSALHATNDRLEQALEELRGFNAKLDRLDARVEHLESEVPRIREATDEIKQLVPDLGRGPVAKAKDALTSD